MNQEQNFILIWKFEDAPEKYRALSTHGGDEDWVAFIPNALKDEWIPFLDVDSIYFGNSVSEHETYGGIVRISAHARYTG